MSDPPIGSDPPEGAAETADQVVPSRVERAHQAAERAKARAAAVRDQALASRGRYRSLDAALDAHDTDRRVAGSLLAGALAFRLFLALLPTVLAAVGLTGLFGFHGGSSDVNAKARELGLTAFVADMIRKASTQSATRNVLLVFVGLIGMWFGSRALLKGLRVVFSLAWRMVPPRSTIGWKVSLAAMGVITATWLMSLLLGVLRSEALGVIGGVAATFAYGFGVAMLLQWVMPHAEGATMRNFLPGAIGQAIALLAIQVAGEFYFVGKASSYRGYYGGIGVAAVLLLWFYLYGRIIVAAAVYNASLWYGANPEGS